MSESGPSREELENYFKNSRAYFDELARHYYETDRDYYNKFIAPFYGPFSGIISGKKGASSRVTIFAAVIMIAVAGAAVSFFLAIEKESPEEQRKIEDVKEKVPKNKDDKRVTKDPDSNKRKTLSDYERGVEYYESEDYENAERYLKRVPVSDKNYGDAQQKLAEIKVLRMTEKYKRYIKPAPLERKR